MHSETRGDGKRRLLLLPAIALYLFLLVGPLALLLRQSLVTPGGTGSALTLEHYLVLSSPSFLRSLLATFKISLIATCITTAIGYLMAYHLVRHCTRRARNLWLNVIVSVLFLSLLIRLYAVLLTFSGDGFKRVVEGFFGIGGNSRAMTESLVVLGLMNFTIPLVVLSMLGPIENINPKLIQAAQSLGATYWKAFLTIDAKLAAPSLLLSSVTTFALCMSAFLIPMILGRGFVNFVSNLIYIRFQEVFDPATGSAMAVLLLLMTLALIYGIQRTFRGRT